MNDLKVIKYIDNRPGYFPNYSTYEGWKQRGRQVCKGEKAIARYCKGGLLFSFDQTKPIKDKGPFVRYLPSLCALGEREDGEYDDWSDDFHLFHD